MTIHCLGSNVILDLMQLVLLGVALLQFLGPFRVPSWRRASVAWGVGREWLVLANDDPVVAAENGPFAISLLFLFFESQGLEPIPIPLRYLGLLGSRMGEELCLGISQIFHGKRLGHFLGVR
jgi:hypothetical protein